MKTLAAFIAGVALAAAGTAGAGGGHALLERVGLIESKVTALEEQVRRAQFAAEQAESAAAWALENSWNEARELRRCGMKPTIRKQNQCFFRLF